MKAMQSAVEQREAITPELLRVVEVIAANPTEFAKRDDSMLPVFALYLLAQFREKRAYPAIVKMFSAPGETSYELVGDTVTEGLKQILASVYDGNPAPLHGLIENEEANEYVRDAAINAMLVLVLPSDTGSRRHYCRTAASYTASNSLFPNPRSSDDQQGCRI